MNKKIIEDPQFQDIKVRYYTLMIRFYENERKYLDIAKSYHSIYETKIVQADQPQWEKALKLAGIYLMLAPHDSEQNDMMLRFKKDKKIKEIPSVEQALILFTTHELMVRPIPQEQDWTGEYLFQGEYGQGTTKDLHDRINEHNIRVIARYYSKIRMPRMCELLRLDLDETEKYISSMVSDKVLHAKIDRPERIVTFGDPKENTVNAMMNNWSANTSQLLNLVEKTCHLINKENMMHNI